MAFSTRRQARRLAFIILALHCVVSVKKPEKFDAPEKLVEINEHAVGKYYCSQIKLFNEYMSLQVYQDSSKCSLVDIYNSLMCKLRPNSAISFATIAKTHAMWLEALNLAADQLKLEAHLGRHIASLINESANCHAMVDIKQFLFRYMELGLLKDREAFLHAYLNNLNDSLLEDFMYTNMSIFLKFNEAFASQFKRQLKSNKPEAIRQFVELYIAMVEFKEKRGQEQRATFLSKTVSSALRTGGFYTLLFATSQLTNIKPNGDLNQPFAVLENVGLIFVTHLMLKVFDRFNDKINEPASNNIQARDESGNAVLLDTNNLEDISQQIQRDAEKLKYYDYNDIEQSIHDSAKVAADEEPKLELMI